MNRLDELAGWAAANEEQLRAFGDLLDELVADRVPVAIEVAERIRREKRAAWAEGYAAWPQLANPYEAGRAGVGQFRVGGSDGS